MPLSKVDLKAHEKVSLHIDFDSTLFDTRLFGEDLWQDIAQQITIPIEQIRIDAANYYTKLPLRSYDFIGHMNLYGLHPENAWERLNSLLDNNNYLYSDSADFIQALQTDGFNPKILSFGETHFQTAKIVPNLERLVGGNAKHSLEYTVVFQPKSDYLAATYPRLCGALVDDVPNQNLPDGFTEIHLDRTQNLAEPARNRDGYTVSNLAQARQVILAL